jgi:putative phosphoesterase
MKKIVVLSDTHVSYGSLEGRIYDKILSLEPDVIIHAGDIVIADVLIELEAITPEVYAVRGNMDYGLSLPSERILEIEGVKIGISHPGGPPSEVKERLLKMFAQENVKVIIFGHTHKALIEEENGILFFNPGSAGDKIFTRQNSIGWLLLEAGKILEKKIIPL